MDKKPQTKLISIPSLNGNGVDVVFVDRIEDAYRFHYALKSAYKNLSDSELRKEIGGSYGRVEMLAHEDGESAIVMIIRRDSPLRNLVHESFHATHMLLDYVGISKLNYDTHEIYAYTLDYIFEQLRMLQEKQNTKKAIANKNKLQKKGKKT